MAKIIIPTENGNIEIDTNRKFEGYEEGDIICYAAPFFGIPLVLEIAIRRNGNIIFRKWFFDSTSTANKYLHFYGTQNDFESIKPTGEQIDTVNGLFSGRIKFEGIKLAVGATLQELCPIDVKAEERRINKKIYVC